MTLDVIYDLINYIVGKEWAGGTFTIPQFNELLPMAQYDLLNAELEKVDAGEMTPIAGSVIGKSPLRPFYKSVYLAIDAYGFANLPSDYLRWSGVETTDLRRVEVVSHQMFAERQSNVTVRADINPFGVFANNEFCVCPYDLAPPVFTSTVIGLRLWYIRIPLSPYYDYCQDPVTLEPIYMPVGSYIIDNGTTKALYDKNGNVLADSVLKTGAFLPLPSPPYVPSGSLPANPYYPSKSVEMEWDENVYPMIIRRVLEKVGINLQELQVTQYAMAMEGEIPNKK